MPGAPRVVMLTGNKRRHRFATARLARGTHIVAVLGEATLPDVPAASGLSPGDADVVARHFAERDEVERRLLGVDVAFPTTEVYEVPRGGVNAPETLDWIRSHEPEMVVLYGTSIVRSAMLASFPDRVINVHLGLSPYYRGSGTNFWPLVNGEPECVGATIHLATAKVDAGSILSQVRPDAAPGDRAHDLGTKTITAAFDLLPAVLAAYIGAGLSPQTQELSRGREYRRADFSADAVRQMWQRLDTGMMSDYVRDEAGRRRLYPIVEPLAGFVDPNQRVCGSDT